MMPPDANYPGPHLDPMVEPGVPGGMQERGRDPQSLLAQMSPEQQQVFGNMTPEQQTEFIKMLATDYGGAVTAAEGDMSRADAIRGGAGPQGIQAGRVYRAANPLQHIASGIEKYRANRDYGEAKTARDSAMADMNKTREDFMRMLGTRSGVIRDL